MATTINEEGLIVEETEVIRERVASAWQQAFAEEGKPLLRTESDTPQGQLIDNETAAIADSNAQLLLLSNMFDPRKARGIWQDALGYIYFQERKKNTSTVVTCQCVGLQNTIIPYGALVQNTMGYTLGCIAPAVISKSGTVDVLFRVIQTGPIDIHPQSVTKIISIIPGWDTVNNEVAGAIGQDLETPFAFEVRRARSVALNSHGSVAAVDAAVAALDSVIDSYAFDNISDQYIVKHGVEMRPHSLAVCVYGGSDEEIGRAIYLKKGGGCWTSGNTEIEYRPAIPSAPKYEYMIYRAEATPFAITVNIYKTSLVSQNTAEAVKKAVYDDFYGLNEHTRNGRVGLAQSVFAGRFDSAALSVPGVEMVESVLLSLNGSELTSLVIVNADVHPVLTLDDITVNFIPFPGA